MRIGTIAICTSIACSAPSRASHPSPSSVSTGILFETFDKLESIRQNWIAIIPEVSGATTVFLDGTAKLVLPSRGSKVELRHVLDAATVRGKHVTVSARIQADSATADARISFNFGTTSDLRKNLVSAGLLPSTRWRPIAADFEVPSNTTVAEITLVLQGQGNASFDDIRIEATAPTPPILGSIISSQQLKNIEALTRVLALIRYRHPSDQAFSLDWNSFFPFAVQQVALALDHTSLLHTLRMLIQPIAPTVEFSEQPMSTPGELPHHVSDHLARWRYIGFGSTPPYSNWREGRDDDLATERIEVASDIHNFRCKNTQLHATVHHVGNEGQAYIFVEFEQAGMTSKLFEQKLKPTDSTQSIDVEVPGDTWNALLGVRVTGRAHLELEELTLTCDGRAAVLADSEHAVWVYHNGETGLYSSSVGVCGKAKCLTITRNAPDATFLASRDMLSVEIADHLWAHIPLAVWSDGTRTFPETGTHIVETPLVTDRQVTSISTLANAWSILWLFYPYFQDQRIDWLKELSPAIAAAAAGRSIADTHKALARLLTRLRDNHAQSIHPSFPTDGIVPIALRRFSTHLIVIGAPGDYAKLLPIGSEVISINDKPALQAYDEMSLLVSSATSGWQESMIPFWLMLGPVGTFSTIHIRTIEGKETRALLPHLPRKLYDSIVRESRPAFGSELANGIYYIDLEAMKSELWQSTLPTLTRARAVVLDMRGYPSNAVFAMLGHFTDKELHSPEWQIPILGSPKLLEYHWTVRPLKPRLQAKIIVLLDGRAGSAAETFLQMVQDHHLATLIGETSAGTNGNVAQAELSGGFSIRFTGLRVPLRDKSALQGHGIVPDVIVHPTLEGTRAGRDEILEAAIAHARKLTGTP